jgi:hypothetical protein
MVTALIDTPRLAQIFDLIAEENRLNVYAGELEVRPPRAPTIEPDFEDQRW